MPEMDQDFQWHLALTLTPEQLETLQQGRPVEIRLLQDGSERVIKVGRVVLFPEEP